MKKKILITGGAGFIGSSLKSSFKNFDYEFLSIGRSQNEDINIDLSDASFKDLIIKFSPDIVIHLASGSNIARAEHDAEEEYKSVVVGTNNLVKALISLNKPIEKFIYISSQAVYGLPEINPVTETHSTSPINAYGRNKLLAEKIIIESKLKYLILRAPSIFGFNQNSEKSGVIAKFINKLQKNESPEIFNSFDLFFDFLYVKDLVDSINCILPGNISNNIFNVGSGIPITLKAVTDCLYLYFPNAPKPILVKKDEYLGSNAKGIYLDITKIEKSFGWKPKYTFEQGIKEIFKEKDISTKQEICK